MVVSDYALDGGARESLVGPEHTEKDPRRNVFGQNIPYLGGRTNSMYLHMLPYFHVDHSVSAEFTSVSN